jgi:hypothetical protein
MVDVVSKATTGGAEMMWRSLYAAVAVIAALAVFLLAEWSRMPGVPAPDNPGRYALLAGLLWPVLVLGIAQWGLIAMVASRLRRTARPVPAVSPRRDLQPSAR